MELPARRRCGAAIRPQGLTVGSALGEQPGARRGQGFAPARGPVGPGPCGETRGVVGLACHEKQRGAGVPRRCAQPRELRWARGLNQHERTEGVGRRGERAQGGRVMGDRSGDDPGRGAAGGGWGKQVPRTGEPLGVFCKRKRAGQLAVESAGDDKLLGLASVGRECEGGESFRPEVSQIDIDPAF